MKQSSNMIETILLFKRFSRVITQEHLCEAVLTHSFLRMFLVKREKDVSSRICIDRANRSAVGEENKIRQNSSLD